MGHVVYRLTYIVLFAVRAFVPPPVGQKQFVFVHVFGVCLLYVLKYTDVEGRVCEKDFSL